MSLEVVGDTIRVIGHCRVEEAEVLVELFHSHGPVRLDFSHCESLHSAVAQAILAFRRPIVGSPTQAFIRDLLAPALAQSDKVEL